MHIAFLTPEYPHEKVRHAAGIGTSVKNLAVALVQKGVKVSIFVYSQKEMLVLEQDGITIHLIPHKKYKFFSWFFYRKYIQNYLNRSIYLDKIDWVEAPDWTGITAFMNLKAPLVIRFHGSDAYFCHLENRKQKLKNYWFEKLGMQKANAFIAPTNFAGKLTEELFHLKNKEIKTIHNGIQLDAFSNQEPSVFEKGLLLYIGTIIRKKGVFELPDIFKRVVSAFPEAKLVLIGSDSFDIQTNSRSTWEILEKQFDERLKENVTYLGKIPYEEVSEYIKKANVCIFPTYAETLGMVTIESMAMQKAVVNSNIGWANELLVDGESGFLVHPASHELYASKITMLLKDKKLVETIGENAKKRVETYFDIEKVAQQNIDFYKRQL